jgi:hypothetical protein
MSANICPNLLVSTQGKQVFESLVEPSKMVVDLELTPGLRQLLQLPEEWKIFPRILQIISHKDPLSVLVE